jgi:BioD-like phosphotransacetylase family protein
MHKVVVASTREGAGKTSVIIGLGRALGQRVGYVKPFGDRLLYRKKRLWDYDSALIVNILGVDQEPEQLSIGFDHSKLRFMYDADATRAKLAELLAASAGGKDLIFIEAGKDLGFGGSVHLDCLSLVKATGANLVIIVSGEADAILDDIVFIRSRLDLANVRLSGVIANQVPDVADFRQTYGDLIDSLGVPLLGVIPYRAELTWPSVRFLADILFAKVLAGESALGRTVQHIFVGAMAAEMARRDPRFSTEQRLVITSGDRSDMILEALSGDTAGIVLTNNITPPPNIIAKAAGLGIPLVLAAEDTYTVAKRIDDIEHLLTQSETGKIELLTQLVRDHVDLGAFSG